MTLVKLQLFFKAFALFSVTLYFFLKAQYVIYLGWETDFMLIDFHRVDWWPLEKYITQTLGKMEYSPWILQELGVNYYWVFDFFIVTTFLAFCLQLLSLPVRLFDTLFQRSKIKGWIDDNYDFGWLEDKIIAESKEKRRPFYLLRYFSLHGLTYYFLKFMGLHNQKQNLFHENVIFRAVARRSYATSLQEAKQANDTYLWNRIYERFRLFRYRRNSKDL